LQLFFLVISRLVFALNYVAMSHENMCEYVV
jgi:hypothetical protein